MKYLLDTCAISEFVKPVIDEGLKKFVSAVSNDNLFLSTMTIGELHKGVIRMADSTRKSELTIWLGELEEAFENRILPFDFNSAIHWAKINAHAESKGQKMSAFDSIIASVASSNDLVLITRNTKDFVNANIEIINPWSAQHN